jgi:hypothetical protein
MTTITLSFPSDVIEIIDSLCERELLTRTAWLRREVTLAIRGSQVPEPTVHETIQ